MADLLIAGILLIVVGFAVGYIVKAKRQGVKCIGCPACGHCSVKHSTKSRCGCGGAEGCHCEEQGSCDCHHNS